MDSRWVRVLARCGLVAASGLLTANAEAQVFPLGGRTAQMGGAATASGTDSAMPYLNPAGLAGLPRDVLALSANIYGVSRSRITPFFNKNYSSPPTIDEDSQRGQSLYQLPSSIMYLTSRSAPTDHLRHSLGVSLIIPGPTRFGVSGTYRARLPGINGSDSDKRFFSYEFTDYNLGFTYALAVGQRLRAGVTLFGRYTSAESTEQLTRSYSSVNGAISLATTISSTTLSSTRSTWAKVGAQAGLSDELWLGVSLATPTFLDEGSSQTTYARDSSVLSSFSHLEQSSTSSDKERLPWSLNAGLSYDVPRSFALSADVTYTAALQGASQYTGVSHFVGSASNEIARDYYRSYQGESDLLRSINLAVGGEFWVASWLAWRLGAFTSFNSLDTPDPQATSPYNGTADTFGATTGFGLFLGPTETSLGLSYQRTAGKMVVYGTDIERSATNVLADYRIDTLLFMLSGVVTIGEARDQIKATMPAGSTPSLPTPANPLPVNLP